jgi:hypothetical protein
MVLRTSMTGWSAGAGGMVAEPAGTYSVTTV